METNTLNPVFRFLKTGICETIVVVGFVRFYQRCGYSYR